MWGYSSYGDARTVDVHIGQLRKKLGAWSKAIQTVWGLGYKADAGRRAMSRSTSFRWRLMAALAGVSLFTLLVVGVIFYVFLGGYVLDRQEQLLLDQAMEAADQVQGVSDTAVGTGAVGEKVITALLRADLRVLPAGAGIVVFKGDEVAARVGTTPAKDENLERLRLEAERIAASGPASGMVRKITCSPGVRRTDVLIAAAPISLADGTTGLAVVTLARTDAVTARTGVFRALLLAGAIAIVLAILVGSGLGSWMAEPLRRLSAAAHRMAQGSYEQPVTGSYPGRCRSWPTAWR